MRKRILRKMKTTRLKPMRTRFFFITKVNNGINFARKATTPLPLCYTLEFALDFAIKFVRETRADRDFKTSWRELCEKRTTTFEENPVCSRIPIMTVGFVELHLQGRQAIKQPKRSKKQ